jgi:hypothetical protein
MFTPARGRGRYPSVFNHLLYEITEAVSLFQPFWVYFFTPPLAPLESRVYGVYEGLRWVYGWAYVRRQRSLLAAMPLPFSRKNAPRRLSAIIETFEATQPRRAVPRSGAQRSCAVDGVAAVANLFTRARSSLLSFRLTAKTEVEGRGALTSCFKREKPQNCWHETGLKSNGKRRVRRPPSRPMAGEVATGRSHVPLHRDFKALGRALSLPRD